MSALAKPGLREMAVVEDPELCRVMVLLEDLQARAEAMDVCNRLVAQFEGELNFVFSCWEVEKLKEPLVARQLVADAAIADIIIFSTHGNDLTPVAQQFLDRWAETRVKAEGALALLFAAPLNPAAAITTLIARLELAAAKSHTDFLPLLPESTEEMLRKLRERSQPAAPWLNESLDRPPQHWGLNE